MDIIQKFGNAVSSMSLEDPGKARRLLLTGYRLQEKRLLFFADKKLPKSGQYVARIVMKNIIQALSKPENSAMVSIFVPGELDGGRADSVFGRSNVLLYRGNKM